MSKPTSAKPAIDPRGASLRWRAARARDAAGRFMRRSGQVTDQPEPASLPDDSRADRRADAFPTDGTTPHDVGRGHPDDGGRADAARGREPRQGQDMGRHETFKNAAPIAEKLLAGVSMKAQRAASSEPPAPQSSAPRPANSHPGTYALRVTDDGLGLHAAPGSSVLVEPVTPTGAGLAVFYSKHADGPGIFDLTHDFRPEFARPFAPGSEVMPLVEVIDPETGKPGRIRADKFDKIHRIVGIYTPADLGIDYRPAPPRLPVMRTCPEGMGTHRVEEAVAYPLVRPGETVVYDGMRREPTHGALCVLQWNNGNRSILLTNQRPLGNSGPDTWCVDPVNRPPSRAAMDRRLQAGRVGTLYSSDGPYTAELLREKIVGTVVGILVPGREPAPQDEPAADATAPAGEAPSLEQAADPSPDAPLAGDRDTDPIFAAIERHVAARAACVGLDDREDEEGFEAAHDRATEALDAVERTQPTSVAGLLALARHMDRYLNEDAGGQNVVTPTAEGHAFVGLLNACLGLAERWQPGMDRSPTAPAQSGDLDPIFAAIEAHAAARADLDAASNAADEPWRKERGLDVSAEALALAERARDEANARETETWNSVFATRPTTTAGLAAMARHAQQWAPENTGLTGGIDVDGIFGTIAADIERLTSTDAGEPPTVESVAPLSFDAYTFDDPVGSPAEWTDRFAPHSMGLCIADKTLRMTKPELITFIRGAAERGEGADEAMFKALNAAQDTLEGWSKLLSVAAARYLVAASAMTVEDEARQSNQGGEA